MVRKILGRELYTLKEVAELLGLKPRTIRGYIAAGRLKGSKFGKAWHFTREEVDRFITGEGAKK